MPDTPPAVPPPAGPPPDDPVTTRPLAPLILISMFVLMLTVSWSLYNEFFGLRPWRDYQARFAAAYVPYLQRQQKARIREEETLYATPDYQRLKAAADSAAANVAPIDHQLTVDVDLLEEREGHAVGRRAEGLDLLSSAGLLFTELVARDPEHREAPIGVALLQVLKAYVLRRQAAAGGNVDHQNGLVGVVVEVERAAVERVDGVVVKRHGTTIGPNRGPLRLPQVTAVGLRRSRS